MLSIWKICQQNNSGRIKTPVFLFKLFIQCILVFIILQHKVYSQSGNLPFEHFTVDKGMPAFVNYILQDRTGYLWFATWGGLYKYDGYNFISYKHDLDDTTSIIDNTLSTLYEDKAGVLWIGSWLGLEKFDYTTNTFIHYTPNPSDTGKGDSNSVWAICEDKYGVLWIGTGDGLYKFNRATGKFTRLQYDSTDTGTISHNAINAIYEDKEGFLWFGTSAGLDKLDFKTGKFIHYWLETEDRSKIFWNNNSKYLITAICEDDAGIIWLGTNGGLVEFNPKAGTFINYRFNPKNPQNHINSICQDVVIGSLWIAAWGGDLGGLFSFDKKSKKFTPYDCDGTFLISERSGTLWIGTNTEIRKLNRIKQLFKKYSSNDIAISIEEGKEGILWILTFNEWKKFDIRMEKFIPYSFGKDTLIYVTNNGELLIGTDKGGMYGMDTLGHITLSYDSTWKEFISSVSYYYKTAKGYWAGTLSGGLYFLDPKTKRITKINNLKKTITYIYEDTFGLLWIATYMGKLFCYNLPTYLASKQVEQGGQEQGKFKEFISDTKNPLSISGKQINAIYEDKKRRLWFATINGLDRFERSTNRFVHFTEKSGLSSNNVRGILEDDHGYLWLNTSKGISKFDPGNNHFKNYDVSYGLEPASDLSYGNGCKTRNGEMYFGGIKGFTRFHPDSVKDNPFIPPIEITSFKKFDKSYPITKDIHLSYNENFLSFEFSALSYISPERNQYAYKMEGLDKDWIYSGTRRYASYPNLDPGEYIFRVKGSNNDDVWNEAGTSISIIILPPWWKTTWAYILYSILILSILYFAWEMQVKRIRLKHEFEMSKFEAEKLHEVDEMKSRFFANISHEFRTPLTLILGPVKQIIERIKDERTKDELRVVHKNANRLLALVNQLLDISKLESGNMKLKTIPQNIIPLLKTLVLSFCSYAERKRITLNFSAMLDEIIVYIDNDKIEKIITNVLSNAFKFTPEGGRIEVSVKPPSFPSLVKGELKGGFVEISISDTGIGITKEKIPKIFDRFYQVDGSHTKEQVEHPAFGGEGTGIGLSLTKELIELHKGKIKVESEEGKGTTFIINIPLGKEHLKLEEICEAEKEGKVSQVHKEIYTDEVKTKISDLELITEADLSADPSRRRLAEADKTEIPILLIVEDNSDIRKYIRNYLNKDFGIIEAIDGEDGWNKSLEQIPDLIISDVMMPKMDGFKLCEKIKTDERTSHIPVILLTAKASSVDKIEGFETGADEYIMKPFEPDELKARIKNLIEQRKRIHEHFRKHGLFEIEEKNITPVDQKFLQKTVAIITEHISDPSFGVEKLANDMAVSRSLLLKKIEALIGEPPNELIKRTRLNKAAKLIEHKSGNISEIAFEVGFNNPSYFTECFRKQFGINPSQYYHNFNNT